MDDPVLQMLKRWKREVEASINGLSAEKKAEAIGLANLIQHAIGRLELCERFGILPASIVKVLPDTDPSASINYRVLSDDESGNPDNWVEVQFETGPLRDLSAGDLIVLK